MITGLISALSPSLCGYPLSLQQRTRLQSYLPYTFPKLQGRDPIHVVLIGEGNLYGQSPIQSKERNGDVLNSFAGIFLSKLAREFSYWGGVSLANPPKGVPAKVEPGLGPVMQVENLAAPHNGALSGLQRVKSDAFVNRPDLILVQFGSSDALNRVSIDTYWRTLHHILEECGKRKVDVILFGPTPVNQGSGAMEWGITRPYATAARWIAEKHKVMFIDTGPHLVRRGGAADFDAEPAAGTAVIGDRMKRIFHVPDARVQRELQHLNPAAHQNLGKAVFYDALDGSPSPDCKLSGQANFDGKGGVETHVTITNESKEEKFGFIGALSTGGLNPAKSARRYRVKPGESATVTFSYSRRVVGQTYGGADVFYPLEIDDEAIRFPFLIEDGVKSEFADLLLVPGPVSVTWKSKQYINITDRIKVDWDFVNGTDKPVKGTYRIGMGHVVGEPQSFSVGARKRKNNAAIFPFSPPAGRDRFQRDLYLEVEIKGETYRFVREMEATRDLALGEKIALVPLSEYEAAPIGKNPAPPQSSAPTVVFDALIDPKNMSKSGIYTVIDLNGVPIPEAGKDAALQVALTLDGRPANVVRSFGAVSPIVLYFKKSGRKGYTASLPLGAFGDGYNMRLRPEGITSVFNGSQVQIKIPQSYLHLHNWDLKSGQSLMGVRLEVSVADLGDARNPFSSKNTFVTHHPEWEHKGRTIRGMQRDDARGLTTLRFTRQPMNSWSVRVY